MARQPLSSPGFWLLSVLFAFGRRQIYWRASAETGMLLSLFVQCPFRVGAFQYQQFGEPHGGQSRGNGAHSQLRSRRPV